MDMQSFKHIYNFCTNHKILIDINIVSWQSWLDNMQILNKILNNNKKIPKD